MTEPRRGDYFVTSTNGWMARIVQWVTGSSVNHAGIFVGAVRGLDGDQVMEARPGGAGYMPVTRYPKAIWSTGRLPAALEPLGVQRLAICLDAVSYEGTPYGFADILAIAFAQARLGSRVQVSAALDRQPWYVRRILSRRTAICSQLVSQVYTDAGVHLFTDGRLPQLVSPGDLLNLLTPES